MADTAPVQSDSPNIDTKGLKLATPAGFGSKPPLVVNRAYLKATGLNPGSGHIPGKQGDPVMQGLQQAHDRLTRRNPGQSVTDEALDREYKRGKLQSQVNNGFRRSDPSDRQDFVNRGAGGYSPATQYGTVPKEQSLSQGSGEGDRFARQAQSKMIREAQDSWSPSSDESVSRGASAAARSGTVGGGSDVASANGFSRTPSLDSQKFDSSGSGFVHSGGAPKAPSQSSASGNTKSIQDLIKESRSERGQGGSQPVFTEPLDVHSDKNKQGAADYLKQMRNRTAGGTAAGAQLNADVGKSVPGGTGAVPAARQGAAAVQSAPLGAAASSTEAAKMASGSGQLANTLNKGGGMPGGSVGGGMTSKVGGAAANPAASVDVKGVQETAGKLLQGDLGGAVKSGMSTALATLFKSMINWKVIGATSGISILIAIILAPIFAYLIFTDHLTGLEKGILILFNVFLGCILFTSLILLILNICSIFYGWTSRLAGQFFSEVGAFNDLCAPLAPLGDMIKFL